MGFKLFLGISPPVTNWSTDSKEFSILLDDPASGTSNPLAEFVELPEDAVKEGLWYSNLLCGVIRGACEMVRMRRAGDRETKMKILCQL